MSSKKTALYCRVAAAPKCDNFAMQTQKNYLTRFAKEHGYVNTEIYEDNGVNGLSMHGRPALDKLQLDIETGSVKRVIIRNLSRIGRNTRDVSRWVADIESHGVELISLDDSDLNSDLRQKLFNSIGGSDDE